MLTGTTTEVIAAARIDRDTTAGWSAQNLDELGLAGIIHFAILDAAPFVPRIAVDFLTGIPRAEPEGAIPIVNVDDVKDKFHLPHVDAIDVIELAASRAVIHRRMEKAHVLQARQASQIGGSDRDDRLTKHKVQKCRVDSIVGLGEDI